LTKLKDGFLNKQGPGRRGKKKARRQAGAELKGELNSMIYSNIFDVVKQDIPIGDVIAKYLPSVDLKSSGRQQIARCPFHDSDDHASFNVYTNTNSWYCFGCGKGGSTIDLVMEAKGLCAYEAAKELATAWNIPFQEPTPEEKEKQQKIETWQQLLAEYVAGAQKQLGQDQREALHKRGLTDETIAEYQIGFDPTSSNYKPAGEKLEKYQAMGLIGSGGGYLPRGRVVIPVFQYGKPIYVIFWDYRYTEKSAMPKYLYPFGASKPLAGLDLIRKDKPVYLVEGIFDWLSMRQAGYIAVCALGTSVKAEYQERLKRASQVYIMFDNDSGKESNPGQEKARELLRELYPAAKNIILPDGKDPNDCFQDNPEGFKELIDQLTSQAKDAAEVLLNELEAMTKEEIELPANAIKLEQLKTGLILLLAQLDSETTKDVLVNRLYKALKPVGIAKKSLQEEVKLRKKEQQAGKREQEHKQPEQPLPEVYKEWAEQVNKTGRYLIANPGYLCAIKHLPSGDIEQIPIANFAAKPTRQIIRDNGLEINIQTELEGILVGGWPLPKVAVSAEKFSSMNWVTGAWGLQANIEPGMGAKDRVRHAIQSLADGAKKETVYTHLGWRKLNNRWIYLHAGGAIGADDVLVDLSEDKLTDYVLPDNVGDIQENAKYALQLLDIAKPEITFPLLSYVFLAPLCEALRRARGENAKSIEPSFILWLLGQSGNLKSTIAALFLCFFGAFSEQNLLASFKDTPSSLEKKAFLTKDSVLVVDDYHPVENRADAQKMRTNAQLLLRGYGNHLGRSRMKADTSLRAAYIPRGLCIVTGEDLPDAGESTIARFLVVEIDKGNIDINLLTQAQANAGAYSHVMRGYIEYLAGQMDKLPNQLSEDFFGYRELATKAGQHLRLPEAVAWLSIGMDKALEYFEHVGVLNSQKREALFKQAWDVFLDMAERQSARLMEEKPSEKFLNALAELLMAGVVFTKNIYYPNEQTNMQIAFIGWHDDSWFYLLPEIVYKEVVKLYTAQGRIFPVTQKRLWKYLEQENLIQAEYSSGRANRTVQGTFDGKRVRVLKLTASAVKREKTA
jgi:DNA primase catalytic core